MVMYPPREVPRIRQCIRALVAILIHFGEFGQVVLIRTLHCRGKSGLMVRSLPATSIQLGLVLQAAVVVVAEKLSAELSTCERARNVAWSLGPLSVLRLLLGGFSHGLQFLNAIALTSRTRCRGAERFLVLLRAKNLLVLPYCVRNLIRWIRATTKLFRMWWPGTGLNRRRRPFQGRALPLSYLASVQT